MEGRRPCKIHYNVHIKERKFDFRYVVGERFRRRVLPFTPVDERGMRLGTIRIIAKFFNRTVISAHIPIEEKDDETKDAFYERLELTY